MTLTLFIVILNKKKWVKNKIRDRLHIGLKKNIVRTNKNLYTANNQLVSNSQFFLNYFKKFIKVEYLEISIKLNKYNDIYITDIVELPAYKKVKLGGQ